MNAFVCEERDVHKEEEHDEMPVEVGNDGQREGRGVRSAGLHGGPRAYRRLLEARLGALSEPPELRLNHRNGTIPR